MNHSNDLTRGLAEALSADPAQLQRGTELKSLPGWDSLGQISVISLFDQLGVKLAPGALQSAKTVADLLHLAKGE